VTLTELILGGPTETMDVEKSLRKMMPEQIMLKSIEDQIVDLFGASAAKALNYHVNPSVAPLDPLKYEEDLKALLGPMSSRIIEKLRIGLCEISGKKPDSSCKGIEGCLECIIQNSID
jgi:hypothetical protein